MISFLFFIDKSHFLLYNEYIRTKGEIKMTKFVEIIIWKHGYDEQVIINVDDIARLSGGPNILTLKTPFADGSFDRSISSETADKLRKILNIETIDAM